MCGLRLRDLAGNLEIRSECNVSITETANQSVLKLFQNVERMINETTVKMGGVGGFMVEIMKSET